MPTASAAYFDAFVEHVAEKVHNLGSDTLKVALTNTAPAASNAVLADITQIAAGSGYSTGGFTVTTSSSAQTSGTYTLSLSQVAIAASGGTMATWRYAVLYNDTPTSPADPLILYWDFGAGGVSLADGESVTIKFNSANPGSALTIHKP